MTHKRPHRPSWRVADGRALRPELWLAATGLVALLLVEVWQSSHAAELCLSLDRNRTALHEADARLQFLRADFERRTTRAELTPLASKLGLAPADAQQVVGLPAEYLAPAEPTRLAAEPPALLSLVEKASRALVPEARAKSRIE
jgi:hypothetical protein